MNKSLFCVAAALFIIGAGLFTAWMGIWDPPFITYSPTSSAAREVTYLLLCAFGGGTFMIFSIPLFFKSLRDE